MATSVLFVSGVQRSGTTALANLLSTHPEVRVCIERYKYLFGRNADQSEVSQELFSKRRILDFSDGYTNLTPESSDRFKGFYKDLERDYETLRYIGDKVPGSHDKMRTVLERIPAAKIVFIVRDVHEVSNSWDIRAKNPDDSWPPSMSALQSVKHWNDCNKVILDLNRRYPGNILVVDYHSFFGEVETRFDESDRLLAFLGLSANNRFRRTVSRLKVRSRNLSVERSSTTGDTTARNDIEAMSNVHDYEEVMKLARLG